MDVSSEDEPVVQVVGAQDWQVVLRGIRSPKDAVENAVEVLRRCGFPNAAAAGIGDDPVLDVVGTGVAAQVRTNLRKVGKPEVQRLESVAAHMADKPLPVSFSLAGFSEPAVLWVQEAEKPFPLLQFDYAGVPQPMNEEAEILLAFGDAGGLVPPVPGLRGSWAALTPVPRSVDEIDAWVTQLAPGDRQVAGIAQLNHAEADKALWRNMSEGAVLVVLHAEQASHALVASLIGEWHARQSSPDEPKAFSVLMIPSVDASARFPALTARRDASTSWLEGLVRRGV